MKKLGLKGLVVAAALVAGGTLLQAQEAPEAPDEPTQPDVEVPGEQQARLSPQEMTAEAEALLGDMEAKLERLVELKKAARKQKDVIKLNCVNSKLAELKTLLNIAESARINMAEAIAQGEEGPDAEGARYHEFGKIVIASQQADAIASEAEACIGDELVFLGPTDVQADEPALPDDPTSDGGPSDGTPDTSGGVEPPAAASPIS